MRTKNIDLSEFLAKGGKIQECKPQPNVRQVMRATSTRSPNKSPRNIRVE